MEEASPDVVDRRLAPAFELMQQAHAKPHAQRVEFVRTVLDQVAPHAECWAMRLALTRTAARIMAAAASAPPEDEPVPPPRRARKARRPRKSDKK